MTKTEHLRVCVSAPGAIPTIFEDGTLVVSCLNERSGTASLLCIDMALWGPHGGAEVQRVVGQVVHMAFRQMLQPDGVSLDAVRIVTLDAQGNFDFYQRVEVDGDWNLLPIPSLSRATKPRSKEAFLAWSGEMGQQMLDVAFLIGCGGAITIRGQVS